MYSNHTINNDSKNYLIYNDVIWLNLSEKPYCLSGVRKLDKYENYFEKDGAFPDQLLSDRDNNLSSERESRRKKEDRNNSNR
jgi:hypothetical protein